MEVGGELLGMNNNKQEEHKKSDQGTPSEPDSPPFKKKKRKLAKARIVVNPKICGGEPTIKGTRILLRTILASLAEGDSIEEILNDFPTLSEDDIRAVIAFAAASTEDDLPLLEIPAFK